MEPSDRNLLTWVPWYARPGTLHSLRYRDWSLLWMSGHTSYLTFWMDLLVLGWLMLELTGSPIMVSLVGSARILLLGIMGPIAGFLGDVFSKKRILVIAQLLAIFTTGTLAIIMFLGTLEVWHVYLSAFMMGLAWSMHLPVRLSLTRDLVPEESIVNAMSLNGASLQGMSMTGRFVGGVILAVFGAHVAYAFLLFNYLLGLALLLKISDLHKVPNGAIGSLSIVAGLKEGMHYCLGSPAIRGVLLVTVIFNLLVIPYFQLTSVFAKDILEVGPALLGLMTSMEGLGALLAAVALATAHNIRRLGLVFIVGTLTASVGVFLFSISQVYALSLVFLLFAGFGMGGFVTAQVAIPTAVASAYVRSRVMGVTVMAMGTMPIGMALLGYLTSLTGPSLALAMTTLFCALALLAVSAFQPGLRNFST
jgi:MFS family permease